MNMAPNDDPLIFAPALTQPFAARVAALLHTSLAAHEEREFEGGEHKMRPLQSVRGRDVYVLQNLCGTPEASANDRLCRLLFFIGALKDAGASSVTACLPYLAYARKDRRTKARDPITTRYVAALFETMGTDRVLALDVHNLAAFENAFRCEAVHLQSASLLIEAMLSGLNLDRCVVASPDPGGVKRAQLFQEKLAARTGRSIGSAFIDKRRSGGVVSGGTLVGEVAGCDVVVVDDMISSGGTVMRAVASCREAGARRVSVAVAHAVFTPESAQLFGAGGPDRLYVSDSVPLRAEHRAWQGERLVVCGMAPLFAAAIGALHRGESLGELSAP